MLIFRRPNCISTASLVSSLGDCSVYRLREDSRNMCTDVFCVASDGKIILKLILTDIGCECLDRVNLGKDRNQWRNRANTVINLGVPQKAGKF